jgi:hypothetical protein
MESSADVNVERCGGWEEVMSDSEAHGVACSCCVSVAGLGVICMQNEYRLVLKDGTEYRFDWHDYCGPTFVNKRGEPLARQPGERNPMWKAFNAWAAQGRKVDVSGTCIWAAISEPQPILEHIGGRQYRVIGWTDPDA